MDQGHSRFPENFSPKASRNDQLKFYGRPYGLSLCHGANGVPPIIGIINGLLGFSQSPTKINEYTIQPELLHLNWIDTRIPVKEGYITLALRSKGESKINIPAGCTVNVINKNGNPSLKLKKAGIYKFKLYHNE